MFTVNERNTHGPDVSVLNVGEEDFSNVHRKCFEYPACKCSSGLKVTFLCVCVCVQPETAVDLFISDPRF